MRFVKRVLRALPYLALATLPATTLWAQDSAEPQAYGSGVVLPIVQEIAELQNVAMSFTVTGTDAGFAAFCDGSVALVGATRPMSAEESSQCLGNGITYQELLVGHEILALIANPSDAPLTCLFQADINRAFAPSSAGNIMDWSALAGEPVEAGAEDPLSLTVYAPTPQTLTYTQLDALVSGDGLRRDATLQSTEQIIAAIASESGALGVVNLEAALNAGDSVLILDIDDGSGCFLPSAENVENRFYSAANRLFVYVNADQADTLAPVLEALSSEETSSDIVRAAGVTPPTAFAYEQNALIVRGEVEPGRSFSQDVTDFEIPATLVGEVRGGGAANAYNWARRVSDSLTSLQANLTINLVFEGEPAGLRRLCNGEVDFIFSHQRALSSEQVTACQANNITPEILSAGTRATVLVANQADDFALCLTTARVRSLWESASTDTITNWNQLGESFPDLDITLFGYNGSDATTDLLFAGASVPVLTARQDTEVSFDPLYRAAATANVSGAITYMSWQDYLRVQANGQQNIQLVAIDNGAGCITPSEQSINNGSYALSQPVSLIINQASLTDINVRSYLWSLFADENATIIDSEALVGLSFATLPSYRATLEQLFARADAAAQIPAPEGDTSTDGEAEPAGEVEATPEASAGTGN